MKIREQSKEEYVDVNNSKKKKYKKVYKKGGHRRTRK